VGDISEKEALFVLRAAEKLYLSCWEGSHLLQILMNFLSDVFLFHFVLSVSHPKTCIRFCIALELAHYRSFGCSVTKEVNGITEVFSGET